METPEHIKQLLKRLPNKPGVYQHFDVDGQLLYVGKAKDIKKRVSSYFNKNKYENGKTRLLVKRIHDIKFMVVETEFDALLLENSLIKKYQPKYNIALKDDKSYPSIVIKKERFPRIFPTRQLIKDGSEYHGPYANVKAMHALLDLIKKLYPIRTCKYNLSQENIDAGKFKVCLEYHLGNCLGPCEGKMSEKHYNQNVDAIRNIIKGDYVEVVKTLKVKMAESAANMEFEQAAAIKNRVDILERFQAKSTIVHASIHNTEVFSIISDKKSGYVNYMKVMNGSIVQGHTVEVKKRLEETDAELLEHVIVAVREQAQSSAKQVLISSEVQLDIPEVQFHVPQRGDKRKLLDLSMRNAKYFMRDKHKMQEMVDPEAHTKRILETMKADLRLTELPVHIECFDNSNIQGTNPASACVVFKNAKPSKQDYRKFNIKTVVGPDDFASMEEVVYRRYKRLRDEGEPLPQLVIIDGGKGQLSSSMKAIDALGLRGQLAVIGIAKRLEEIFFPGDSIPIYIDKRSESLKLIQQLRNEAHRFSLSHHRNKRSKAALKTSLTDVEGVGMTTARKLLDHFKTVEKIKKASVEDLQKVVNLKVSQNIY
ncbi:MAG: excinuclease ABC subunit UvrC, partial [Flavobacteriales bacterium]|nr:excinuclease ABC subunit UvrC [Flavobacteriales bacterium]